MTGTVGLSIQDLSVWFNKQAILHNVSLELQDGEILTVVGPSGCGKSTLLNVIGGIIKPNQGEVTFRNQPIDRWVRGYIPQSLGLLPWKKVRRNIFLAQSISKKREMSPEEAQEIVRKLGIETLLDRYPDELSGGQRQRVALARLFVSRPDILLMDEPFSALDPFVAQISRTLFLQLWKKHPSTTIFTTHNLMEAVQLGQKIMIMSPLPGRILKVLSNPLFDAEKPVNSQRCYEFALQLQHQIEELSGNPLAEDVSMPGSAPNPLYPETANPFVKNASMHGSQGDE